MKNDIMEILEKSAELTRQNSESTAVMLKELQAQGNLLNGLSNRFDVMTFEVSAVKDDVEQSKYNEEITTAQVSSIRNTAEKRIVEILGNDPLERQKYFKIFSRNLYTDARKYAGLGSAISCTKKGDFQRVIDYIESWNPKNGCMNLMLKADENAAARKKAKELGYVVA